MSDRSKRLRRARKLALSQWSRTRKGKSSGREPDGFKPSPSGAPPSKHFFRLKGEKAEAVVQELASKTFFVDWCFPNPKLPDGKELCDLLVVFGDVVIIWQIKDLKLGPDGHYKKGEVEKNVRQLAGARRQLFDLKTPVQLANPRLRMDTFDPGQVKEVFLISVLLGEGEDVFNGTERAKDHMVHVFTRDFVGIALGELDTVADFLDYLRKKEAWFASNKSVWIMGGEQELLANFLTNNRSFSKFDRADVVMITEGCWDGLQRRPEYIRRLAADRISYLWDGIIDRAHTAGEGYEMVARELARPGRFERRYLSKSFLEAHKYAHNAPPGTPQHRRVVVGESATYAFLFMDDPEPRDNRKAFLSALCWIARGTFRQRKTVLGVATEMKIARRSSHDFCLMEIPEWTDECEANMKQLQEDTGILVAPIMSRVHEDEYPPERAAPK